MADRKPFNRRRSVDHGKGVRANVVIGTVRSVCLCESFDLIEIAKHFEQKHKKDVKVHRLVDIVWIEMTGERSLRRVADVMDHRQVRLDNTDQLVSTEEEESPRYDRMTYRVFFFSYGIVVWWSHQTPKFDWLLGGEALMQTTENHRAAFELGGTNRCLAPETCRWVVDPSADECRIEFDMFTMPSEDPTLMLACSHGLAQSTRLTDFEAKVEDLVQRTKDMPLMMLPESTFTLPSSEQLCRLRGELFLHRMDINLHTDMLDTPEYFWTHTDLEPPYLRTRKYMEITNRVTVLNKRIEVVQELFGIVGEEIQTRVGNSLEWYIIWLLFADFMVGFVAFLFDFFKQAMSRQSRITPAPKIG
eukprot:TRINITY_DN21339_c0_g2_i1.p1 TRINITY_DN21339_c0_g2~~TRINITY_DN21339_c0_g2_i1.p1  ORF type:complete len:360 (+),score=150.26 TRINITY_DN21339_c0_g2_i1:387-1466(+)